MQRTPLPCLAMDATLPFLVVAGDGGLTTPGYHWKERSRRREEAAPDGRLWQSGTISAPGRLLALATMVKRGQAPAEVGMSGDTWNRKFADGSRDGARPTLTPDWEQNAHVGVRIARA